ncbi:hypothetical protein C8A03DRAFT_45468 [Achaetomium macrosporum]|uniref:Aminoglycoside phosphotransferase domain-containing protein n=1 Tax=Achaetomium macrosporum TaxID=79813 RepID=A0AAN7C874_9PEZI|nr:hypothetical protein C8A03DRAFT_45468 [Achaetomium macrosporum]
MAPNAVDSTSAGSAKNPARAGPAPPPGRTQPITTVEDGEDDDEMEDEDDDDRNPLHDEPDEVLAGTILQLCKEPNEMVAHVVADEMMTRLRELRQRAVEKVVKHEVKRAVEEIRNEMQEPAAALRVALPGVNAFPDEKVRVEVATLRYIEKMTSIPVPHVYHWGTADENPWALLASIMLELSKLEMPKIGSLQCQGDDFVIGSHPLTMDMNELVKSGGIPSSVLPPEAATYSASQEWYEALADMHVAHLTFQRNNAIESADDCRDKFVARHLFRQAVRQGKLLSQGEGPEERKKEKEQEGAGKETFRLWVDDLRPHNMLVDADLNIVGVIDWEWAYFAPAQFAYDPPYWLLLERPEFWRDTVLEWRDEFSRVLDIFCRALRRVEEERDSKQLRTSAMPVSERMRESWKSGKFWESYAARRCYGFDPVFWEFPDERFFGKNTEGGYEGRMNLLSDKVRRRMELFVDRKVEESKEKIEEWDPEEARLCLGEVLSDLS